jgi:alginate O-acetyltransferase complex protein AlgI
MLFNSYEFILLFLPVALAGFFFFRAQFGANGGISWLVVASLFFYGWWNPVYLVLIVSSMLINFAIGRSMARIGGAKSDYRRSRLIFGIILNLSLLGYFKYAMFLVESVGFVSGRDYSIDEIILPLAISFFTFQQIAYLIDAYEGSASEYSFTHYALFVTFFPQLIAGPIVHHAEMMPQFMRGEALRPRYRNFAIGGTIFAIGLFKKTVLADGVAQYSTPVFAAAYNGVTLDFFQAWGGSLAYTMQLYFDFSGYSDMAIGSARLFGVRLPINFFSPYKATSIVEFWRRWHMTLSRFLRDYLYIPLGGNRRGKIRRHANLLVTMLLGGLWHGAGWTFVMWGALHGSYLIVNHLWHWVCQKCGLMGMRNHVLWKATAWLITFVAVVVGWVFFRAESFDAAVVILRGMAGLNGASIPNAISVRLGSEMAGFLRLFGVESHLGGGEVFVYTFAWVIGLMFLTVIAPNTVQLMQKYRPTVDHYSNPETYAVQPFRKTINAIQWRPNRWWAIVISFAAGLGFLALSSVSEFLYFQF